MPTTNPLEPDTPPRPTAAGTVTEFGSAMRTLRRWSGFATQKDLEDADPELRDSTISDHERGFRLPRLEWLHAYVTRCLRKRYPAATPEYLNAEFAYWRTAWTQLQHATTGPAPAVPTPPASTPEPPPADHSTPPVTANTPAAPALVPVEPPAITTGPKRRCRVRLPGGRALIGGIVTAVLLAVVAAVWVGVRHLNTNNSPGANTSSNTTSRSPASTTVDSPPYVSDRTYTQTVNTPQGARTYTNPRSLVGEGPRVENRKTVEVSCKIIAPSAPSVGTYWYRITSPPWNNQYYSPTNSFLNGDPIGGPYAHDVDPNVPYCPP